MRLGLKIALAAVLCLSLLGTFSVAYGLVIEDVVVCHDFDVNGNPVPMDQFPVSIDAVFVWVNMTDLYANESMVFEWWPPSGEVYHIEEWYAPFWVGPGSTYSMFTEIEIMGEPAETMPGVWAVDIYNNETWWGHAAFELVDEGTPSLPDPGDVPMNVMGITNVETPDGFNEGDNVTVKVTVGYNFEEPTDIAPSVWNNRTQTFVGTVEDTVSGMGVKTYDISFIADEPGTSYFMVAYFVNGSDIVYTDEVGIVPFRLEDETAGPGVDIPSLEDFGLPTEIDLEEIQNQITDYVSRLRDLIPDDLSEIEDEVRERTGIPGYPLEALVLGASALVYALRRRD